VAAAAAQRAAVVLRITPATFPLETAAEQPFDVLAWLRAAGGASREWHGWCRWARQRYGVRLLATRLSPAAAEAARRRVRRKAQQKGRIPSTTALWLAEWLLVARRYLRATGPQPTCSASIGHGGKWNSCLNG
jgi:hypothetical protein